MSKLTVLTGQKEAVPWKPTRYQEEEGAGERHVEIQVIFLNNQLFPPFPFSLFQAERNDYDKLPNSNKRWECWARICHWTSKNWGFVISWQGYKGLQYADNGRHSWWRGKSACFRGPFPSVCKPNSYRQISLIDVLIYTKSCIWHCRHVWETTPWLRLYT